MCHSSICKLFVYVVILARGTCYQRNKLLIVTNNTCIKYDHYITRVLKVLLRFSLTLKAATLIFISGCGSAISSAKEGKSGFIYNLVTSK